MKRIILIHFLFLYAYPQIFSQNLPLKIGYGSSVGLPKGRYIHNFFVEKTLINHPLGSLKAELSYFHSPTYWLTFKSNDPISQQLGIGSGVTNPSKIRQLNLGVKIGKKLIHRDNFYLEFLAGAMLGYGIIEREESITTLGTATSTSIVFNTSSFSNEDNGIRLVLPLQLDFSKSFSRFGISLIPVYYFIWKNRGNTGIILSMNI